VRQPSKLFYASSTLAVRSKVKVAAWALAARLRR
jgi:hypothetical protein